MRAAVFLAALAGVVSAMPFTENTLVARQDNCTTYSSPSAGTVCLHRPSDCTATYLVQSGDTCNSIASIYNNFTLSIFRYWNPDIGQTCFGLQAFTPVCIGTPWYSYTPPAQYPDQTVLTLPIPETELPVPVMPSIVAECNKFYLAANGDRVDAIAARNGVTVDDMLNWNPAIDKEQQITWAGYWVCVGVSS